MVLRARKCSGPEMNSKAFAGSQRRSRFGKWDPKSQEYLFFAAKPLESRSPLTQCQGGAINVMVLFEVDE